MARIKKLSITSFTALLLISADIIAADDYGRFPQGTTRLLTYDELKNFEDTDLALIRNEIFARHGYDFSDSKFRTYFSRFAGFKPVAGYKPKVEQFSNIEQKNIWLIRFLEGQRLYENGDFIGAYQLLLQAAEHNVAAAQNYIGIMYEKGLANLPQSSGLEWYQKAYTNGDDWAGNKIGELLMQGKAISSDKTKSSQLLAASYFIDSANKGNEKAKQNYSSLIQQYPEINQQLAYSQPNQNSQSNKTPASDYNSSSETNWGKMLGAALAVVVGIAVISAISGDSNSNTSRPTDNYSHSETSYERQIRLQKEEKEREQERKPIEYSPKITPIGGYNGFYGCANPPCM